MRATSTLQLQMYRPCSLIGAWSNGEVHGARQITRPGTISAFVAIAGRNPAPQLMTPPGGSPRGSGSTTNAGSSSLTLPSP